ncbi:glutamyl aminopeptidase-like isoform X2 [Plodia interpunctella]|uniref:glutamyl aminopeptidase-like isoform X2 n=1 Tax=Plodia interpunctella TaxID=58824 RepID=UPI0023687943|nr:glutamyl aminopeptidase-like isoform X2 [Plodia interpunctella]
MNIFRYRILSNINLKLIKPVLSRSYFVEMEKPVEPIPERLSPFVRPVHYTLALKPDLSTGLFKGNVLIDVVVKQEKNFLYLHTKFLNIKSLRVLHDDVEVPIAKFCEVKQNEQLVINFNNCLSPGNYQVDINFDGDLTRNIVGFYLSHLKDNRKMVASKFQPTYARQAFPCFDEPDFKATFDITLTKPTSYVALSNMNEVSRVRDDVLDMDSVTFARSVPMSTYLACFVVCDFDFKETEVDSMGIGKNFVLRSFAQKGQTNKIDFALDIGKRVTEFYIKYYEVPFPLPKLDMIAIPDYQSGATEHWGLITYRETSFLVDETTSSSRNKVAVANTIAHELAHMWFGNLVTLKWWDELWLNEGFATYMQVKALDSVEPSWTMLDQFLTKTLHSVLVTDAKLSSHPIVQTVDTPDQITSIFDAISYNKGSSVLRMLEGFVGAENFRRGVSDYLKKYMFGNTVTQDLLSSLEPYFKVDNPQLDLKYIMDTWTRQMGYPLLTLAKGKDPNTFVITQSRFLLNPDAKYENDSEYNYRWFVPITYKTNKGTSEKILWFSDKANEVTLKLNADESWLKINNNQVGYYRVNYPEDMWRELIEQLKEKTNKQLTISDRAHLLNEVFALAEARVVPYELALDLTCYLPQEQDYVPWNTATAIFTDLSKKLRNTPAYDDLMVYVQKLITPLYESQSWEKISGSIIDGLLRSKVLRTAAWCSLPAAVERVRSQLRAWLRHPASLAAGIEPDLRDFVYYEGMKSATQEEWDRMWEIYQREEDAQEQAKLRAALSAPSDTSILMRYLTLSWDEKNIRSQDYLNVLQHIAMNPSGTSLVWSEVRANWPRLVERFTLNSRYLGGLIPGITSSFNTDAQLKEMEDFFAQYPQAGAGETARRRALETVRNNVQWHNTQQEKVAAWLRKPTM